MRILLGEARLRLMAVQSKVGQPQADRLDRLKERRRNLRDKALTTLKAAQIDSKIAQLEKESLYSDDDDSLGGANTSDEDEDSDDTSSKKPASRAKAGTMSNPAMEQQRKAMALLAAKKKDSGGTSSIESSRDEADNTGEAESRKRVATALASTLMAGVLGARGALKPVATKEYDESGSPAQVRRVEPVKVQLKPVKKGEEDDKPAPTKSDPELEKVVLKPTGRLRGPSNASELGESPALSHKGAKSPRDVGEASVKLRSASNAAELGQGPPTKVRVQRSSTLALTTSTSLS